MAEEQNLTQADEQVEGASAKKSMFRSFTDRMSEWMAPESDDVSELQADVDARMLAEAEKRQAVPPTNILPGLPSDWDEEAEGGREAGEAEEEPERKEPEKVEEEPAKGEPPSEEVLRLRRQIQDLQNQARRGVRAPAELRTRSEFKPEDVPEFDVEREDPEDYRKRLAAFMNDRMKSAAEGEERVDRAYRARAELDRLSEAGMALGARVEKELDKENLGFMREIPSPYSREETLPDGTKFQNLNPTFRMLNGALINDQDTMMGIVKAVTADRETYERFQNIPPIPELQAVVQESRDPVALIANLSSEKGAAEIRGIQEEIRRTGQAPNAARAIAMLLRYDTGEKPESQRREKTKMRRDTVAPRPDEQLGGRKPRTEATETSDYKTLSDAAEGVMNQYLRGLEKHLRDVDEDDLRRRAAMGYGRPHAV